MKTWGSGGIAPPFLTTTLDGGEWSASLYGRFIPEGKVPGINWRGGWEGSRGLDAMGKIQILTLPGIELLVVYPHNLSIY
jgi:hypothetical protein